MSDGTEMVRSDQVQVPAGAEQTKPTPVYTPAVDIYETEDELVLLADLPGVSPESLRINLEDDLLTLEGEVETPAPAGEWLLQEYGSGRYWRQFTLGEAIEREQIQANLKNGELKLVLPKAMEVRPHRIEVKAS